MTADLYNENDARATYAKSIKAYGSSSVLGIRSGLVFANKLLYLVVVLKLSGSSLS